MRVKDFMVPKDKVVSVKSGNSIREAGRIIIEKKIGSVIVTDETGTKPVGIITRTELVKSYVNDVPVDSPVTEIMNNDLLFIDENQQKDHLAELMMTKKRHHVLVKDSHGQFVGLTTSLDVVTETALDAKAFPYHRNPPNRK